MEYFTVGELKQNALTTNTKRQGRRQCIVEVEEFLSCQEYRVKEYDDLLDRKLIEKDTAFESKLTIE